MGPEGTIAGMAILPAPWPPPQSVTMIHNRDGDDTLAVTAETTGRLTARLRVGGSERVRSVGPLLLPGACRVFLLVSWSDAEVSVFVNNVQLLERPYGADELRVRPEHVGPPNLGRVFPMLGPGEGRSEAERLFLATVLDLDTRLEAADRYNLIRASGLLRQLLLDETPLVHLVNREYRIRIVFRTLDYSITPPGDPEAHWQSLDPTPFPHARTTECSLKQFLAAPCLRWRGRLAGVSDLIRACANAKGGVHLGKTDLPDVQLLLDWDDVFNILGEQPSIRALAGVCRVALYGLTELVDAVRRAAAQQGDEADKR